MIDSNINQASNLPAFDDTASSKLETMSAHSSQSGVSSYRDSQHTGGMEYVQAELGGEMLFFSLSSIPGPLIL